MRSTRLRRIDDQIRRIVSEALISSVQDPRIGFVTVTSVEVSREFDTAKVYVTVMGSEEERAETMKGLRSAAPFLQSRIGKAMRLRRIPLLRFLYDESLDRGLRVEAALRGIASGETAEEADESEAVEDIDGMGRGTDEPGPDEEGAAG
jgi:ribosome-binding factor A